MRFDIGPLGISESENIDYFSFLAMMAMPLNIWIYQIILKDRFW